MIPNEPSPISIPIADEHKYRPLKVEQKNGQCAPFPADKDDIAEIWEVLEYQRLEIKDIRKKIKKLRNIHIIKI